MKNRYVKKHSIEWWAVKFLLAMFQRHGGQPPEGMGLELTVSKIEANDVPLGDWVITVRRK